MEPVAGRRIWAERAEALVCEEPKMPQAVKVRL